MGNPGDADRTSQILCKNPSWCVVCLAVEIVAMKSEQNLTQTEKREPRITLITRINKQESLSAGSFPVFLYTGGELSYSPSIRVIRAIRGSFCFQIG